ncbi:hypothetical protein PoB_006451900 [Plakobranchus ocellatus]|uniref:Uncharacterized protein n=1 Tax=Plakobranchus ocellatus TaxID=259542 RepID=A0AAV4D1L3_9GAST|nr:hypothetical protein PoB_006451900 [Plakobranchus ocellatus]
MDVDKLDEVEAWLQKGYHMLWMEGEEYRGDSEVEPDSDHEDGDGYMCGGGGGSNGGWLGHPLHNFHTFILPLQRALAEGKTAHFHFPRR